VAGYSGTPLARKLGLASGQAVALLGAPPGFPATLAPMPDGVRVRTTARGHLDLALLFTTERAELARRLRPLGAAIHPDGMLWVAWPKKASKVPTDITEDVVRAEALPLGLVDTKVCAIDDVWSGLRLVWRREHRGTLPA
jgi:hypothetical protein